MAYTPTYTQGDLSALVLNLVGTVFAAISENIALLILLVIIGMVVFMSRGILTSVFGMIKFR